MHVNQTLILHLTNRFCVLMCVFSHRSKTTFKCGKNKKVVHRVMLSVLLMYSMDRCTILNGLSLFYMIKNNIVNGVFPPIDY